MQTLVKLSVEIAIILTKTLKNQHNCNNLHSQLVFKINLRSGNGYPLTQKSQFGQNEVLKNVMRTDKN